MQDFSASPNNRSSQLPFGPKTLVFCATALIAYGLLTDYRFGARPVFSFVTHGKMDTVFASSSWAIPLFFGFSDTPAAKIFESNSLPEASVVATTDWDSQRPHEERQAA